MAAGYESVWRWGYPHSSLFIYASKIYKVFRIIYIGTVMVDELEKLKRLKEEGKNEELVRCIVEIMIKYNMRPKALPGFDAVRIVRETREE
jgi:hypothetical protein